MRKINKRVCVDVSKRRIHLYHPDNKTITMKKTVLIFLFLLTGTFMATAQSAHLRITALYNFPDTAYEGVVYPIQFQLKNVGIGAYQGPLQIVLQTDSATDILYFNQNPNFVLLPNDTVTLIANSGAMGYVFSSNVFRTGNDVVVVWPYTTQFAVQVDTLYTAVYFVPLSGIANEQEAISTGIPVYPNPFSDLLHLKLTNGMQVEQVRISDLFGKEVYRRIFDGAEDLSLEMLHPGIYILEIETSNHGRTVVKIIKQ